MRISHALRKARGFFFTVLGILLLSQSISAGESATVLLARDASWSYQDSGIDLGTAWRDQNYNDTAWKRGKAPLGYGDDFSETDPALALATPVEFGKPDNKHMTTYFRTSVQVADPSIFTEIEIYVHVDDGAVIYVNGMEAFRRGVEDKTVVFTSPGKFKPKEETFRMPASLFKAGKNCIAVEVHQDGPDSSDLWFELGFKGIGTAAVSATSEKPANAKMVPWTLVADPNIIPGAISKITVTMGTDASNSRGITWYTNRATIASDVELSEKGTTKTLIFKGRTTESKTSPVELVHKAELIGLKAGTQYAFRVGDSKAGLWSETGSFTTSSPSGAFTFIDLADTQAKTEEEAVLSASTLAKAIQTFPDASFIALNGDLVDTGVNEKQWDWFLGKSRETLLKTTFVPAAGNHEEDESSFIDHFSLPVPFGSSTNTGAYYSFNQQNAHFIVLNNNEDSTEFGNFSPTQIEWLKADVAAARKAGSLWQIVIMHKGPYTTSNHATDADIMGANGVRTLVAPLLSSLGIDLVFQGHDHIYARSFPIADNTAFKPKTKTENFQGSPIDYMLKPKGTIYLIPGTAGPKVYYRNKKMDASFYSLFAVSDENHAGVYGPDPADASRPLRGTIQNFAGFTVEGNKLSAVVYEIDQKKNNGTPYIIDRFGIIK
jgi:3',5'-cyclic AMP phosphodiesterase CpdA